MIFLFYYKRFCFIILSMKEKLSLLDVCKLPDVQLHSKKALFKAIISKETTESQEMKDQIVSLSYTIKTIGVQGQ